MSRKILLPVVALLAIGAVVLSVSSTATNCGGNSAALAQVQEYALLVSTAAAEMSADELRAQLSQLSHTQSLPSAHFLVSTVPVQSREPRRVVIVCDTPYRNVPRRWIGFAPATHAAGFSDASAALISPAEFAVLDRSRFIALDELYPTNCK